MSEKINSPKKILIVDDDEAIKICMEDISRQENWNLSFASDGHECLAMIQEHNPALIVLDLRMPKMTGEEVLQHLQDRGNPPPVILVSAEKDLSRLSRFSFIVQLLSKPFDLDDFVGLVNKNLR